MKHVFSIQSISDIITNSSSEVFIIDTDKYKDICSYSFDNELEEGIITIDKIKKLQYPVTDIEFLCELANISDEYKDLIIGIDSLLSYNYEDGLAYWENFVNEHIDEFNSILGKIIINVSDDNGIEYLTDKITKLIKNGAKHVDGRHYAKTLGLE